jgi:hypothetical protein
MDMAWFGWLVGDDVRAMSQRGIWFWAGWLADESGMVKRTGKRFVYWTGLLSCLR